MNQQTTQTVGVVIPFLNEEENIPVMYQRLTAAMASEPEQLKIYFVDDGSTDASARLVAELAEKDPRVKLLRLSRNFGHQIAITAGLDYADTDAVVIIDCDLQDPPEVIPGLLAQWRAGHDVVVAVRKSRDGETWLKKFLAASFYRIFHKLAKIEVPMDAGDFRLADRKVVEAMRSVRELHRFMRGLSVWVGFKQTTVTYERAARYAGSTKYPVWKSAKLAWDAITSFSGAPLRWMMGAGLTVSAAGVLLALRLVFKKIFGIDETVPGWTSQVTLLLLISGIQLMCLGLLGQYVSRLFEESKRRPLYFLQEVVDSEGSRGRDRR
ncbi:MAG: glycosyltransferase family 2 protein [Verrucomicrobia bacterium]|nr:glycosyltransferase family 2 protein [Kiritimatiellia bacterium]MCP5488808.1 glycosyltransferase family 2 protein [Verrucomicrobiota bacterium]